MFRKITDIMKIQRENRSRGGRKFLRKEGSKSVSLCHKNRISRSFCSGQRGIVISAFWNEFNLDGDELRLLRSEYFGLTLV